tara:strand:+ start:8831 stop:9268 length:438 start_codon:yes stop_codon:yes gene_type:complete
VIALLLALAASPETAQEPVYSWRDTLHAIRAVETGGCPDGGIGAVGDGGNALGPYQIWSVYHQDAAERDRTLTAYRSCLTSTAYSERVVRAYMNRYAKAALRRLEAGAGTLADVETVARIHNGGPKGATKKATLAYWAKVRKVLR